MTISGATDFEVLRDDVRRRRFAPAPAARDVRLSVGDALLRIDAFALTANTLTYATLGDAWKYWDFFPAADGWGRIPAWGFGTIVRSCIDQLPEGLRYYGYFPISSHVVMRPQRIRERTFSDGVEHRAALHPLYNQYALTPRIDERSDALQLLLRPLFITSFVLDDMFADNAYYGARRIVVSSASSKTAYGMAFLLHARKSSGADIELVGLTSAANTAFVRGLGFYDTVATYDEVEALPTDAPALFVDFSANARLTDAIHRRLGDSLRCSSAVGYTHWDERAAGALQEISPPTPVPFFSPAQIQKRARDWGPGGFEQRFGLALQAFTSAVRGAGDAWLRVSRAYGAQAVERVYDAALAAGLRPEEGHILSLPE